jgi:hypothetical protein
MKDNECFDTYLGKEIQNKMIVLISNRILRNVVLSVKAKKYVSVIMACTPDTSHKEQLSILLQFVEINQKEVKVKEYFLFLHITDSSGSDLFNTFVLLPINEHYIKRRSTEISFKLTKSKQQNICKICPPKGR